MTKKDQTAAPRRPRIFEGGCSTIVVGRAASATGRILVGHNEDNDGRIVTNRIWVPAADHAAEERLAFESGAAVLPQAPHTLAHCWTQTLHPQGASYSDSFINEAGVLVVSNNCNQTWERDEPVVDGGVGYAVRRLIAERARTAREGVEIALDLQTRWGYRGEGRTYTIADPHEAWQVFLLRGHRWAARRIQDDEVVFTANAFALDRIDDVPPEDVMLSPDLVDYAVRTGRYLPENGLDHAGLLVPPRLSAARAPLRALELRPRAHGLGVPHGPALQRSRDHSLRRPARAQGRDGGRDARPRLTERLRGAPRIRPRTPHDARRLKRRDLRRGGL